VGGNSGYADTAQGLINAINAANLGLTASFTTAAQAGKQAAGAGASTDTGILIDGTGGVGAGTTPGQIGTLASTGAATDDLSGTLTVTDSAGAQHTITLGQAGTTDTLANLANTINGDGYGITAAYSAANKDIVFTSASSKPAVAATGLGDTTTPADVPTWTATAGGYYATGATNAAGANAIEDTATGQAAGSTFTADPTALGGIATISYSDAGGANLSTTNLTNQADAQSALNLLNLAISDVSSLDGYLGAQINTLNSISQVMSTQQENILSAQNAIQATDYASATSNMSKYEILSQTGIAALAQANQVQQEVLKLLQ